MPVLGMNDSFGQKSDSHGAWPNFANQTRYPWHYHNQHHWPYQYSAWPASGAFTQEHAWDFIKRINCQHHWSCPHYQSYSYPMHYRQTCCWHGRCNGYTPVHHGDEHIGKIFAFGAVIMAISLYYLYKDLFPDRRPNQSNDLGDHESEETTPAEKTIEEPI
jgi:hypothetical protein